MAARKPLVDLRLELMPLFLVILSFCAGFMVYGARLRAIDATGEQSYGIDWPKISACVQWGIPAAGLAGYLLLSAGVWAVARVEDPLRDWNVVMRALRQPTVDEPGRKEAVRARLLRAQYWIKIALVLVVMLAQWQLFRRVAQALGSSIL